MGNMTSGDYVLVTGASGFLGSAVARQALERGFRVRAMVRAGSPRRNLEDLPVEIAEGDMRDARAMESALKGVRYLFHVAAEDRKSTRLNSSHIQKSRMPSSA